MSADTQTAKQAVLTPRNNQAVDALDNVALDLSGASDALCFQATIDGNDLASMVSRVLDADLDAVREVAKWLEANAEKPNDV